MRIYSLYYVPVQYCKLYYTGIDNVCVTLKPCCQIDSLTRDVTIQRFCIYDSIHIQTKCMDSIQIQFLKLLVASQLNSLFHSIFNISSQFSSIHFSSPNFISNRFTIQFFCKVGMLLFLQVSHLPILVGHFILYTAGDRTTTKLQSSLVGPYIQNAKNVLKDENTQ